VNGENFVERFGQKLDKIGQKLAKNVFLKVAKNGQKWPKMARESEVCKMCEFFLRGFLRFWPKKWAFGQK